MRIEIKDVVCYNNPNNFDSEVVIILDETTYDEAGKRHEKIQGKQKVIQKGLKTRTEAEKLSILKRDYILHKLYQFALDLIQELPDAKE